MVSLGSGCVVPQHSLLDPEVLLGISPCLSCIAGVLILQLGSMEPRKVPPVVVMSSYTERVALLISHSLQSCVFGSWAKGIAHVIFLLITAGLKAEEH